MRNFMPTKPGSNQMSLKSQCPLRMVVICLAIGLGQIGDVQEADATNELQSSAQAPPNTREIGKALGGAYFVDQALIQRYEALKARVVQIRKDISIGNTTSDEAAKSLAAIQKESNLVKEELGKNKVLVSAFQVYSKTSEQVFPLGDERLVIITGDNVIIRGWDGPGIKCILEKTLVAKKKPDDSEFEAIRVEHELAVAEDKIGLTREQRDQKEKEFLVSEHGRNLTDEQKINRKKFVDEIHHSYDNYLAFQGKKSNTLRLTGLTHQEGNRNLMLRIDSPEGGGTHFSQWQRHAAMTVYVPVCKSLAVRGCSAGLDIRDLECDLLLTTHGSRERDYEGAFLVRDIKGNVTINQVPLQMLSRVTGDVKFIATNEFVNSGTLHKNGTRTFRTAETHSTHINHINGNVEAMFLRTDLKLFAIKGVLDVMNRYGSTRLTVDTANFNDAHRIVTESGDIYVVGHDSVLEKMPIYAYTRCGQLHTNIARDILDSVNFSTGIPQKEWNGFVTPSKEWLYERPATAIENRDRTAGLDLISHAGRVSILATKETK